MSREQLFTVWQNRNSRISRKPVKPQVQQRQKEAPRELNLGTALGGSWGFWCEFSIWAGSWTLNYRDPTSRTSSWKRDGTLGPEDGRAASFLPYFEGCAKRHGQRQDWFSLEPYTSTRLFTSVAVSTTAALQAIHDGVFLYSWHTQGMWMVDQAFKCQGLHPGIACMPDGTSEKPCSNLMSFCTWWKVRMHCLDSSCTSKATLAQSNRIVFKGRYRSYAIQT